MVSDYLVIMDETKTKQCLSMQLYYSTTLLSANIRAVSISVERDPLNNTFKYSFFSVLRVDRKEFCKVYSNLERRKFKTEKKYFIF